VLCARHRRKLKLFCHSSQISGRISLHLAHDLAAVNRRGNFARSQCRGDLFREHTGNYETHDVALTHCKSRVAFLELRKLVLLLPRLWVALQRLLNRIDQILIAERLGQKFHRARLHRFQSWGCLHGQ
jgi:hypothetical protein